MVVRPYVETQVGYNKLRRFSDKVDEMDLVWHRDRQNRRVTVLESDGWQIQLDNDVPQVLRPGTTHYITKETYHRIIKGQGPLIIMIEEL